ncbi:MAG: bifunctional diguanylate cyclase/phosphodiesterase [Rhodobacterales bacterium]|nr:bifunctional diguanylate cyclase/phosphodiesterase [Rhodobacterales bacterium]
MWQRLGLKFAFLRRRLRVALSGPHVLAFLPAVALGAFWFGGEPALLLVALGSPVLFALVGGFSGTAAGYSRDSVTGLALQDSLEIALDRSLAIDSNEARNTACYLVEIDDYAAIMDRYGQSAADEMLRRIGDRIRGVLRDGDQVCRMGDSRFGVALAPVRHLDLEVSIQLATRLQSAVEEPISLDATNIYVSCCIGFCLASRVVEKTGEALMSAAGLALIEANRNGPSAIRAFSEEMKKVETTRHVFMSEASYALENGQIQPWFQPQISTDTGKVTGFEALARWMHPTRGMISPAEFLPALEQSGQLERLGEVMIYHALTAAKAWDFAGVDVPQVGVNFAGDELRNPKLVDKTKWELDRFDLDPNRLAVEVLETVVAASPDDTISRNINGLAKLGCQVDLDDFGTGHASISSIRRFAVKRIKIDRSFVMKVDRDPEQQRMVAAILTMAERLGLDTLAEGVETASEHAMLAQLGCGHVQGFGIGRPMPFDQTIDWIKAHNSKLQGTPKIGRKSG